MLEPPALIAQLPAQWHIRRIMSVRSKVILELAILTVLTFAFLALFPRRHPAVDIGLAAFALACIGLSAGYTKRVVWAASPPPVVENRLKQCLAFIFRMTVPPAIVFLLIGMFLAYQSGGWPAAIHRVLNWRIPAAFACYLPWALMQQTLFQFYLLGRILALFPNRSPMIAVLITGFAFALVHLPDVWSSMATMVAGSIWSFTYYRYRLLLPIAFSHAILGTAFYYGLFGHDLAVEWRAVLP